MVKEQAIQVILKRYYKLEWRNFRPGGRVLRCFLVHLADFIAIRADLIVISHANGKILDHSSEVKGVGDGLVEGSAKGGCIEN